MNSDFRDPQVAQDWDANTTNFNPTRPEQIDLMLSIIADAYQPGDVVLDLGFGSGLVEAQLFARIPGAQVIGVDISPAMMALAHQRLKPYASQYRAVQHDLAQLDTLPVDPCRFIISSQALHHLTDTQMQSAYRYIRDLLTPNGIFLLLDRVTLDPPELFGVYQSLWRWQDRHYKVNAAATEGATFEEHAQAILGRGDFPLSAQRHLELMRAAGLKAACLHVIGIRALLVAQKS